MRSAHPASPAPRADLSGGRCVHVSEGPLRVEWLAAVGEAGGRALLVSKKHRQLLAWLQARRGGFISQNSLSVLLSDCSGILGQASGVFFSL